MAGYVAAVQMECITGEIRENSIHIIRLLEQMKQKQPEVVLAVFPEMALYGYEKLEEISTRTSPSEIEENLKEIASVCQAQRLNAVVGAPYFGKTGLENALYFLNIQGVVQHVYSKMHLIETEKNVFVPGKSYGICQTPFGKIGFLICWDSAFPETGRTYAGAGVRLLAVSAAWENPYERQWELAVCGRSFDNDISVAASNCIGKSGGLRLAGQSMITDCLGNILAEKTDGREGFITADLDQMLTKEKRRGFGSQIEELKDEGEIKEDIRVFIGWKEGRK